MKVAEGMTEEGEEYSSSFTQRKKIKRKKILKLIFKAKRCLFVPTFPETRQESLSLSVGCGRRGGSTPSGVLISLLK